jgi:hypothetical protein
VLEEAFSEKIVWSDLGSGFTPQPEAIKRIKAIINTIFFISFIVPVHSYIIICNRGYYP